MYLKQRILKFEAISVKTLEILDNRLIHSLELRKQSRQREDTRNKTQREERWNIPAMMAQPRLHLSK